MSPRSYRSIPGGPNDRPERTSRQRRTGTLVRVPTWLDGVKVALGFIVPCAAFLGIVALVVSSVPTAPVDPQERLREAREREWMSISEKRLNQAESAR